MPEFDRFDICEAWSVWAHDWGEYAIVTRIRRMHFRPRHLSYFTLTDNGQAIYDALNARSEASPNWYRHS